MGGCMDNGGLGGFTNNGASQHGGETVGSTWDKIMGSTLDMYKSPYFDTLGYDKNGQMTGITGGPEQRAAIFNRIDAIRPLLYTASDQAANRALSAASNPGFAAAANLANQTINGKFLNGSPQLDYLLGTQRAAANRAAADSAAGIRSGFARNGLDYSTANQQAEQSNNAAATAKQNELEAGTRYANYAAERANQANGTTQLNAALSSPLNYLSQVSASQLAPLSQIAQLIPALTNGQQQNVDRIERDGAVRGLFKTVGAL